MERALAANRIGPEEHVAPPVQSRTGASPARAQRAEFVVLTGSDELLEQVGQALDGVGEIRHVENEEEARQLANPQHATVMLLDTRDQNDSGLVVERLHASDGSTVIVVFAPATAAADVARAIKGSAAFAVLPIPIEMEKTRAVLHGAAEEALARRALVPARIEPAPVPVVPQVEPRAPEAPPRVAAVSVPPPALPELQEPAPTSIASGGPRGGRGIPRVALAVVAGLVLIAAAAWLVLRDEGAAPAEVATTTAVATDAPTDDVAAVQAVSPEPVAARPPRASLSTEPKDELLDRARVAFHERRYTEPEGDNALFYYQSVLAQDPQDGEAREGLDRIGVVLDGRLKSALQEGRTDDASLALEQLRVIRPDDPALAAASGQLAERRVSAAIARGELELAGELLLAAERAGVAPQRLAPLREQLGRLDSAKRAERLSRLVSERIREGKLLAPAGDSAKYHLGQLLKLPNGKRLGANAADELARALGERARRAAAQGESAEAEQWLTEARALGYTPERTATAAVAPVVQGMPAAPPPATAAAPARLEADPIPAAAPGTPQPGARPEPPVAARSIPAPADRSLSAADFKRIRYVAPVYPAQALARGQSGEVRVRLMLDTEGRVADVEVLSGTPPGVFDKAAVNAVRKWRFEPVLKDGRAIDASVTTTISFRPDEKAER
jgi:protein TonB